MELLFFAIFPVLLALDIFKAGEDESSELDREDEECHGTNELGYFEDVDISASSGEVVDLEIDLDDVIDLPINHNFGTSFVHTSINGELIEEAHEDGFYPEIYYVDENTFVEFSTDDTDELDVYLHHISYTFMDNNSDEMMLEMIVFSESSITPIFEVSANGSEIIFVEGCFTPIFGVIYDANSAIDLSQNFYELVSSDISIAPLGFR